MSERDSHRSWVEYLATSGEKLSIAGPETDISGIDVVVCRLAPQGRSLLYPDNLLGHCTKCFRMVQFRPHAPKEPARWCDECIRPEIEARRKIDGVSFMITENTAADLAAYVKKKGLS